MIEYIHCIIYLIHLQRNVVAWEEQARTEFILEDDEHVLISVRAITVWSIAEWLFESVFFLIYIHNWCFTYSLPTFEEVGGEDGKDSFALSFSSYVFNGERKVTK